MKKIILTIILMLFCTTVYSAQATLSWNPNSESDLAGYKVYYGNSSRSYSFNVNVGNQISYIVKDLVEGETYFFAATAYDFTGNESGYSNEVSYDVPITSLPDPEPIPEPDPEPEPEPEPDTTSPIPPTGIGITGRNTLTWNANEREWFRQDNVYKVNVFGTTLLGDSSTGYFKIPSGWNKEKAEFFVTRVNYPYIESMASASIKLIFRGNKKKGKWRHL
jgi:hypothetical protein